MGESAGRRQEGVSWGRESVVIHMHFLWEKWDDIAKDSSAIGEVKCSKAADFLHLIHGLLTQHHQKLREPHCHLQTLELRMDAKINCGTCL